MERSIEPGPGQSGGRARRAPELGTREDTGSEDFEIFMVTAVPFESGKHARLRAGAFDP